MRIAFDTGGTFTDCVYAVNGELHIVKVPSNRRDPALAIGDALERVLSHLHEMSPSGTGSRRGARGAGSLELLCGTTVGTNALLEGRGGRVALITTAGFEDVLEIGRQARPNLYDFSASRPAPLVPRQRRFGMRERVAADGGVLLRPSKREVERAGQLARMSGAEVIAICFLFSFANPAHERALAASLRRHGLLVSVSHEILPEFREYERTATTVVNAALMPVMTAYLRRTALEARKRAAAGARGRVRVRVMQSNGGILSDEAAAAQPVRTILSGPAGGVLGAQYAAERAGLRNVITFDMGGTSTDVALMDGNPATTNEAVVASLPVAVPMLDIHTVGAGGGSIARFDRGGALRVGPESAGADPGPIAYGRGERPTVTDAHVALGRMGEEGLLAGALRLDIPRVREYFSRMAGSRRPKLSMERFAQGILEVAEATMEKAIRVISVERGHDPRDYALVAFGGAGGLHAASLAAKLGIRRVVIPKFPGALSAFGILRADVVKDYSRTVLFRVNASPGNASPANENVPANADETMRRVRGALAALERRARSEMRSEGFKAGELRLEPLLDARYAGQSYELTVAGREDWQGRFHALHLQRYGYSDRRRALEVVNVRLRARGLTPKPAVPRRRLGPQDARRAMVAERRVWFHGQPLRTRVFARDALQPGNSFQGPSLVTEYSATTVIPPGWGARVDGCENLVLQMAREEPRK